MPSTRRRAVALFSGGLDSALAVCLVRDHGVEVIAFHLVSAFCRQGPEGGVHPQVVELADEIGVPLHTENATDQMMDMVRRPAHGFGRHLNPCIDCRIQAFRRADAYRREIGADFLVSGEVLGQRPMSQTRQALELIDRRTRLGDLLLRPLSARCFPPTLPEREGWVDRKRLLDLRGRSRTEQLALAAQYRLQAYDSPAGGCRLTDPEFCARLQDLVNRETEVQEEDIQLLRTGRHFRLDERVRVICGRDHSENLRLEALARAGDRLFKTVQRPGSVALLRPGDDPCHERTAAGLAVYYSKNRTASRADVEQRCPGQATGQGDTLPGVPAVDPGSLVRVGASVSDE